MFGVTLRTGQTSEEIRNILGIVSVCNLLRQGILTLVGTEGLANLIGTIGGKIFPQRLYSISFESLNRF